MPEPLVLCATNRLAQSLRGEIVPGAVVWLTRQALTIGQWLGQLADEARIAGLADLPEPLDAFAERVLWEQSIAPSLAAAGPLFDLPGMAATAAEAHALCRAWNLAPGGPALSDEARLFLEWQARFEERCRATGWLDAPGVERQVLGLIENGHFALPAAVAFAGFDRLTPFERRLADALAARGTAVEFCPPGAVDRGSATVVACADPAAECAAAAAWAHERLASDPGARLAIVVPDLAAVREPLEFMLDDLLHPALIRPDGAEQPRRFNFSLGHPLAGEPLVRTAFALLSLAGERAKVDQARLSEILLAGGWTGADSEADGRARLDAAMRRDLPLFASPHSLLRHAARLTEDGETPCPATCNALAACLEVMDGAAGRRRAGEWATVFRRALQAAGWPGERPLSSREFQAREAFAEVLAGMARLDALLGRIDATQAVRRLREICALRLFQPETRGRPAVQVLGVLESAGLRFDALWVLGMNDEQWPPAPRPNPLLPQQLQRAAGVARASAEVELDFARRVHQRLLHSAPAIRFSYARADGNRALRPGPLLAGLAVQEDSGVPAERLAADLARAAPGGLVAIADAAAPPVADGEKVGGGSWLLRAQAICPAWAFFQYRLGAEAMETPVEGLDAAARGTLVHAALEAFWKATGGSRGFAMLDSAGLAHAIAQAVDSGLGEFERVRRTPLAPRFRRLEADRLAQLLAAWLAVDTAREHEFTVIACEQEADFDVEGIRVRMVVDRIDEIAGQRVIIDYKTGRSVDTRNWADARITEPQLPIYAALVGGVAGVAFAKVLPDTPGFAGITAEPGLLPGVRGLGEDKQKTFDHERFPDWPALVAHWDARLRAIAREVKDGAAGVVFADDKALRYCEVLPALRLAERRRLLAAALADASLSPP